MDCRFRKLALIGLVLLVGRGTVAQLSSAIVLAFFFFALQLMCWPYKVNSDNVFRAATELHVFIAIMIALVLKLDLSWETVGVDAYDWILFTSFLILVPGAFIAAVFTKIRFVNRVVKSMDGLDSREKQRRAFDLHVLGLGEDQDKADLKRYIDGWNIKKKYAAFLSHCKAEAAAEARILKLELVRGLRVPDASVFLDADNLSDLRDLLNEVQQSDVFILMLTDGVVSRGWCLAELDTAVKFGIPIVLVQINNSFKTSPERIKAALAALPKYLASKNPEALDQLMGLKLDAACTGCSILKAIDDSASLTFDPNQSSVMIRSQIHQLATVMVSQCCPENKQLLSFLDLQLVQTDPWVFTRPIAIYIVFSEGLSMAGKEAAKIKNWLVCRDGIASTQVVLHTEGATPGRPIDDAVSEDCTLAMRDADMLLLLQTKHVLREPRCLARVHMASRLGVPLVPICLVSSSQKHAQCAYDFDVAKKWLSNLDINLSASAVRNLESATGEAAAMVGSALMSTIPNIISKPLQVDTSTEEFEAQMLDIELSLRRALTYAHRSSHASTPQPYRANADQKGSSPSPRARTPEPVRKRSSTPPGRAQPKSPSPSSAEQMELRDPPSLAGLSRSP